MTAMLPSTAAQVYIAGGFQVSTQRPYRPVPGQIVNVTVADDVMQLQSRGWLVVPDNGVSSQRPAPQNIAPGALFVDSTLDKTICWDGQNWRSVIDGSIV